MTSRVKGFVAKVLEVNPNIRSDHYLIYQEVKIAATKYADFFVLCQEMGSEHTTLLLHAEVRWLS